MLPSLGIEVTSTSERTIQAGDLVIVYETTNAMKAVTIDPRGSYGNKFGNFMHKDWIGLAYGSRVFARGGSRGWVYLLAPTPDLWSLVLKHRTQILYIADISMACMYLELCPGCVVLESGTGSGSLTHSLIRAVAPTGHVHTFEFHAERASEAAKELKANGLEKCVTVRQRNIEEQGFIEELHGCADAVFLDLPGPYKVVASAAKCLKPDGRFCSFSPCIEQVQKTYEMLEEHGFTDIQTVECLLREHNVWQQKQYVVAPPQAVQKEEPAAAEAEEVAVAVGKEPVAASAAGEDAAAVTGDQAVAEVAEVAVSDGAGSEEGPASKRQKTDDGSQEVPAPAPAPAGAHTGAGARAGAGQGFGEPRQPQGKKDHAHAAAVRFAGKQLDSMAVEKAVMTQPAMDARGHTGYLTFARKFVGA